MTTVRAATVEDVPALAALHLAAWQIGYRGVLPDSRVDALSLDEFLPNWERNIVREGPTYLIAEEAGEIVGFVSFGPTQDEDNNPTTVGQIYALYIDPDHWRNGYGRLLMNEAIQRLTKSGFTALTLWTWEKNHQGRSFYERIGITHDGTAVERDRFGAPMAEVRYRCDLPR